VKDVQALIATCQQVQPHIAQAFNQAGNDVGGLVQNRVQAFNNTCTRAKDAVVRHYNVVRSDLTPYQNHVQSLVNAKGQDAQNVRNAMTQSGQRQLQALQADFQAVPPPDYQQVQQAFGLAKQALNQCDWPKAFVDPKASLPLLQNALQKLQANQDAMAALNQPIVDARNAAQAEVQNALGAAKSAANVGIQSSQNVINASWTQLQANIPYMFTLMANPAALAANPLAPIHDLVTRTNAALGVVDTEIVRLSTFIHDDVVTRTKASLGRADQLLISALDLDRKVMPLRVAASRAMACGDTKSLADLAKALGLPPPPPPPAPPPLVVLGTGPVVGQMAGATVQGQPAGNPAQGGKVVPAGPAAGGIALRQTAFRRTTLPVASQALTRSTRTLAASQGALPHLDPVYRRATANQGANLKAFDDAFLGKTPQDVQAKRAQLRDLIRRRFAQQPNLAAAAEKKLDELLQTRTRQAAATSSPPQLKPPPPQPFRPPPGPTPRSVQ
jgi:hypothetical protein